MRKAVNAVGYGVLDTARAAKTLLRDGWDGLCYLLWLSNPPTMTKAIHGPQLYDLYSHRSLSYKTTSLYNKGYITRIGRRKKILFIFKKELRYHFLDEFLAQKAAQFQKGWDEKWRLLTYDIPKKNNRGRDMFRNYAKNLGFGMIQQSCWASPYDWADSIDVFCRQEKISRGICLYEGTFMTGEDIDETVERAWKISALSLAYENILAETKNYLRAIRTKNIEFKEYYSHYCRLFSRYKTTLAHDPFLPKEFSPVWQTRERTENALRELVGELFKERGIIL